LKFKAILKSWPNVKVCLLSNSSWLISSKTKNVLVVLVGSVALVVPITLVVQFLIFEPKFLLRLVLPRVFILALGRSFEGSFYCMFLMTSSNEFWSFSSSCQ
jgi:hypothetical protein